MWIVEITFLVFGIKECRALRCHCFISVLELIYLVAKTNSAPTVLEKISQRLQVDFKIVLMLISINIPSHA